jgi:H+-transporting ATPase
VLVTHLSAIEEAAAMDLLCTDKTGTITENRLSVVAVHPFAGHSEGEVLSLAAAASDDATQDPIDLAVLQAATDANAPDAGRRTAFVPFDPSTKRSEATVMVDGSEVRVMKGTPAVVAALAQPPSPDIAPDKPPDTQPDIAPDTHPDIAPDTQPDIAPDMTEAVAALASSGARVLAVAAGEGELQLAGLVALGDPVRSDSAALVAHLGDLGVRVVMVTGDTAPTAVAVARQVGIGERVGSVDDLRARKSGEIDFDVAAGVLPEDKLSLVERGQRSGHVMGMTGDGVNDAPALKRAEVGIAVSTATDVAKGAASLVLTEEGLGNVVAAVETGRRVYQRMLTYTLNKIAKTFQVSLFLGLGLLMTGAFVTTPRLVLLLLFANDFVTMSLATDRVGFSPRPDRWQVPALSIAALGVAVPWLAFAFGTFLVGRHVLDLGLAPTQTLVFVMLVATGQATIYLVRERRHLWASRPSLWMLGATVADLVVVTAFAARGILMAAVPLVDVGVLLAAVLAATLLLDLLKAPLLSRIRSDTSPTRRAEPVTAGPPT